MKEKHKTTWVENIRERFTPKQPLPSLALTLIVPVYNCSERLATTLESIRRQNYPKIEVIIIDAGSTDRSLEVVSNYSAMVSRIYTVAEFSLPEMMNRGISLATGQYVTYMYPGSFYLSQDALILMAQAAIRENYPEILYSGSIQKEVKRPAKLIQEPFDSTVLARGQVPATIVATWFRRDLFETMGKFEMNYQERTLFDFFCRCSKAKGLNASLVDRAFVDFDYGPFTYGKHLRIFNQTWRIIMHHFGLRSALVWFFKIPHPLVLRGLAQSFKRTIFG